MLKTVKIPKQFEPIFEKAQEYVSKYFKERKEDPSKGMIEIFGERYILVRAASMSVDFFDTIKNLYKDQGKEKALNVARQLLFDIAHAIGKQDAKNFHDKMKLKDPIEKLSAGPIHFSHSGWAFVDIFPESKPSADENYYLIYDHPFSFESDAWGKAGKKSDFPVCVMNAGYSSGWCEESFGVTLVASEIMCKGKGDDACRFIMAHPSKIEEYIKKYMKKKPRLAKKITEYEIPGFFKSKQIEEERKKAEEELKRLKDNLEIEVEKKAKELINTKEKLARLDKLAAIGKLAGMVGHELRNPLGVIRNSVYFLRMKLGHTTEGVKIKEHLDILDSEINAADRIVTDILTFGRLKEPQLAKIDIENVLKESFDKVEVPQNIEIDIEIAKGLPQILADEAQLTQAFSNFILNAVQSMPNGGRLTITGIKEKEFLEIDIIDTGEGIAKKHLDTIFEPLFSTAVKGTGLGLSVCQSIIAGHRGSIDVESEVGKGTRFVVKLPITERKV